MTTSPHRPPPRPIHEHEGPGPTGYLALVLAWAVPGLGHFLLGERGRGLIFFLTVHLLFAAGMLVGGIRAINPPEQPIWTYTQFLTGWPMLAANHVELGVRDVVRSGPNDPLPRMYRADSDYGRNRPGLDPDQAEQRRKYAETEFARNPILTYHPKIEDIGAVYCGIAGMLNLLVMFDVLLRITGSVRQEQGKPATTTEAAR